MIDLLKQLQQLDGEIYRLRRDQRRKPEELQAVRQLVAAQEARAKSAEDRLRSLQLAQKEKDVELKTREEQLKKLQGQLFQVKTNKEYSAIQHEIQTVKADNSLMEDAILQSMEQVDQASRERQQEQQRLEQERQRLREEERRVEQDLAEMAQKLATLETQRKSLVPGVPIEALAVYERVLAGRDGLALVPLQRDSCGGCHRRMPPQVVNEAMLGAKLVTCENCNRILYYDAAASSV